MQITLENQPIHTVRFYRGYLELDHNNTKPTKCRDCNQPLQIGEGVFRHAYMGIGFICFNCLRADLLARTYDLGFKDHDAGFHFSTGRSYSISQCFTGFPFRQFSTQQVLELIKAEWKYEIVERSLGPDSAEPGRIQDVSDSLPAEN